MKIGFDSKRLFNNVTGLGNYCRSLVSNLSEHYPEHEYHLFTTGFDKRIDRKEWELKKQIRIHQASSFSKAYWRSRGINKDLEEQNIDLFHGLSHEIPFGSGSSSYKKVLTVHDLIYRIHPEWFSLFDRKVYDFKLRASCKNADRIVAISENTKNDLINHFNCAPEKIEIVYQSCHQAFFEQKTGVDFSALKSRYSLPDNYLLSVGSLTERKNVGLIIDALSLMKKNNVPSLVLVGSGKSYLSMLEAKLAKTGLSKQVFILQGIHDTSELVSLYRNASLFIYPSLYEGFGIPIVEALLSRTPVIAANTSSLKEAGGPDSLYCDPHSPEDLRGCIDKILADEKQSERMIGEGFEYAMQLFSASKTASDLMKVYKSIG